MNPVVRRSRLMMRRILMPASLLGVALLAFGCTQRGSDIRVRFELDDSAIVHDGARRDIAVRGLQFYVHDIELRSADGQWRSLTLNDGSDGQDARVALIELAKAPGRAAVGGRAAAGGGAPYSAIRFTMGVPFDLNHANPLKAAAPLNRSELFWSWQLGYKFLRVDLAEGEREWSFHLGSTGCASASSVRPPSAPCGQPNRMRVELEGVDPTRAPIRIRLHELVAAMRAANHESCTGGYAGASACSAPYALTGLKVATGECAEDICRAQRLFAASPGDPI